jgi:hypothetical protein
MKYVVEMGLRCHAVHTKFHKDCFRHSKGDGIHKHTDSMAITLAYFSYF